MVFSGVWGVYPEMCEQINHIGLADIRDKYTIICAKNNWSEKSPKKFVGAMKDIHDFCIASVEIASLVDIGHPLVCETYIYESEQPGAFTVWEVITKNWALFAQGIDWFAKEITLLS